MNKLMDFCGSVDVLRAMLDHCIIESELHKLDSGTKVTMMIFVEDGEQTAPCHEENDLKVSICDTMQMADSFLKDIRATELAYAENQHKTLWTEADEERMRVVFSNGNDALIYDFDPSRGDDEEVQA